MGERPRSRARFPELGLADGGYESFYLKASHPSEPVSIWLRYTVHKRPGAAPRGSLWLTLFDARADEPWAVKQTTDDLGAADGEYVRIGDARFTPESVRGAVDVVVPGGPEPAGPEPGAPDRPSGGAAGAERRTASWDLTFASAEPPLRHLPRGWMYRAPLPRTKLLSPHPGARFDGRVEAGGRRVELDGWRGVVGQNWGAEHAERWIWLHGTGFGERPDAWLDVALGRVRIGRWTTPWIANGALSLDGELHRLGGLAATRRTEVAESPRHCTLALPGDDLTVQAEVSAPPDQVVGWVYADPDGSEHHTANCSVADMTLAVSRPARPPLTLTLAAGAAYELGMRETDHGVPIQPFPDG